MLSVLGLVAAVAVLILVLSVMNGFDREMRERILSLVPHVTVHGLEPIHDWDGLVANIESHPEVQAASPVTMFNAMILRGSDVETALVTGLSAQRERNIGQLTPFLSENALENLASQANGLILGGALATRLNLKTGGQTRLMLLPAGEDFSNTDGQGPLLLDFVVVGILNSGTEVDQSLALVDFAHTYERLGMPVSAQGVRVVLHDLFAASRLAWELVRSLEGPYYTTDWMRTHGNLYHAIQLSRNLIMILLVSIIAVAAFNIVASLVLIVLDKRADIAVLRSLGATPGDINRIFIIQGLLIGLLGCALGTLLGLLVAPVAGDAVQALEGLFTIKFLSSDVYPISYLPVDVRWEDVAAINATAMAMCFLASLIPARRAALIAPADALRWE